MRDLVPITHELTPIQDNELYMSDRSAAGTKTKKAIPRGWVVPGGNCINHGSEPPRGEFSLGSRDPPDQFHRVSGGWTLSVLHWQFAAMFSGKSASLVWLIPLAEDTGERADGASPPARGREREPGHRLATGPWVRTKPFFVNVKTLQQ